MRGVVALAGLVGALCLAPAAAADFQFDLQGPSGPIRPGSETMPVQATVSDDCQDLLARAGAGSEGVPFTLQPKTTSPYIVILGPDVGELPLAPCLSGQSRSSAVVDWTLALKPDAPGLESLQAEVEAALAESPAAQTRTATDRVSVVGKAIFQIQADAAGGRLVTTEGDHGVSQLTITNFSNCKVLVAFQAADSPSQGSITLPEPITLNSKESGLASSTNVTVEFHAAGGAWEAVAVTINVTPSAFVQPDVVGDPLAVNLLFRNGNAVERAPTPSPPLPLALLVVACAALVARRRA